MKTDRFIKRPRDHRGSVTVRSDVEYPYWRGRWWVYIEQTDGTFIGRRRTTNLGRVDNVNRKDAELALKRRIETYQAKYDRLEVGRASSKADWFVPNPRARGAASELIAAVDLMRRGFHVYRNLDPTGHADLIVGIASGLKLFRIEVKTGTLRRDGSPCVEVATKRGKFDILAVVLPDRSVSYFDADVMPLSLDPSGPERNWSVGRPMVQEVVA